MDSNRILMENGFRFYYTDVIITVARLHPDNGTLLSAATGTMDNPAVVRGG